MSKLLALDPSQIFGTISPPPELVPFIQKGGNGAGGISLFFNNLITLIYIIAAVVFILMFLWGALEWVLSGGDKEKVESARKRITNALIGIALFAVAFAIIRTVGVFTGFQFFSQQDNYYRNATGECYHVRYPSGVKNPQDAVFEPADNSKCP